jgi:membrane-associated phospholipid phosphatase
MKKTLSENSAFLIPYLLFLIVAGTFLLTHSKGDAHLIINQCQFDFCNYFFFLATYIGDGIAVISMVLLLCLIKYRYAVFVAFSNIISAIITQTLKHTLFSDYVRPIKYFEGVAKLKLIPWVENYSYNSFPSGHTTAAFTTFFCFALILENKWQKFLMFTVALIIGFSRVYLSQHFLNDVLAGSVIGVATSLLVYQYLIASERVKKAAWMERSVLNNK